jgi:hypothetical protein
MKKTKSTPVVFTEWKRNKKEVGRLTVEDFEGREVIHLRVWYRDKHGELKPTQRGLTIPPEQTAAIRNGLRKLEKELATDTKAVSHRIKRKKKWPPRQTNTSCWRKVT